MGGVRKTKYGRCQMSTLLRELETILSKYAAEGKEEGRD